MNWLTDIWVVREIVLPALDILILSIIIYKGYEIFVQTRAIQLLKGAFLIVLIYLIGFFLKLQTLLWILNMLAPGLVIGIAIIFQPELRKIFIRIGQGEWFRFSHISRAEQIEPILNAVEILAGRRRGALIVFVRNVGQKTIIDTGTRLNADISSSLMLTIFAHDTPLHDGAIIIERGKILAAGCFLPLSEQADIRRSFGSRHRAALGLVEETDAIVLVVSEETGAISLAYEANLYYDLSINEVSLRLTELLNLPSDKDQEEEETILEA